MAREEPGLAGPREVLPTFAWSEPQMCEAPEDSVYF